MTKQNSFAYFIASYGKPNNISTLSVLYHNKASYPIYIVIGKDDPYFDEYVKNFPDNLLIFNKERYISEVDNIGIYANTHKVCTYSRLAVTDFAKQLNIRYVGYLFDDIESIQLRYETKDGKIESTKDFSIDHMIDLYIDLLNSSDKLYIVGPPNSSFYIGINKDAVNSYSTRFGNMLIYEVSAELEPYKASVLEDMSIVLYNNQVGKMSICPFGMQVNCRPPHVTNDCYGDMTKLQYHQHHSIIAQTSVSLKRPAIPYINFTPKIISDRYRKVVNNCGIKRLI